MIEVFKDLVPETVDGMTMRDQFAMAALQGFLSSLGVMTVRREPVPYEDCAKFAYEQADAMMKAREGGDDD